MSRAFVKEDVDPPERSGRKRSPSGLPPGAANYTTAAGAARLRAELEGLRRNQPKETERVAEMERIVDSLAVVEPPDEASKAVAFGAKVTLRESSGGLQSYRIVGVNELDFFEDAISWVSSLGRTLLASELGEHVTLPGGETAEVINVEYPSGQGTVTD